MKKQAFLFSASDYDNSILYPKPTLDLPSVKYDIEAVRKRLEQIGFDVITKENAPKFEYIHTLKQYTDRCPHDTINIVYFSGHGGHYEGHNYLYPSNFTSLYGETSDMEYASINIEEIIKVFKNKGILILILDACRRDFGISKGHFSEMSSAENVYIAYGTNFNDYSRTDGGISVSWFTEAICDEILTANIDVDELFTRVRQNIITKHQIQLPSSVNTLLNKVYLHIESSYDNLDKQIYDFIERYAEEYNQKHGYFSGEYLVFIDASQYFNVGLLDVYWRYTKVKNKLSEEKGIKMPCLPEAEQKIVSFLNFPKGKNYFSCNISHTWYYNGRQIRMGEIPPLPSSMRPKAPEAGKSLELKIDATKEADKIILTINLPDNSKLYIWDDKHKNSIEYRVNSGRIIINDANDITKIVVDSKVFECDESILGEGSRNLVGSIIKHHPIYGNQIYYEMCFE